LAVTDSSIELSASTPRTYRYLKPSVFWSIRQEFPKRLSAALILASLVTPFLLWTIMSHLGGESVFLPTPEKVVMAGIEMFSTEEFKDNLIVDVMTSSLRVFAGFFAAAVVGVPMGLAIGTFNSWDSLLAPIVGTVRYMPVTAFVPLIIIWLGLGEPSKILIVMLGVVLYNALMVADAVKFIPNEMINVAYTLGATRRNVLFKVIIPAVFPSVLDTLRVNVSGAWNFLVIAELVAAQSGLGYRIIQAQRNLDTDKVLVCIAIIGLIGLVIDYGLKWLSQKLTPWADQVRH
jgi:NitT/TauT family transport system permease protein